MTKRRHCSRCLPARRRVSARLILNRDDRPIESYLLRHRRFSSTPLAIAIDNSDEDDDVTLLQSSQQSSMPMKSDGLTATPSPTASSQSPSPSQPMVAASSARAEKKRNFYQLMRIKHAHPEDGTKCSYCGQRDHAVLHHEHDCRRAGTGIHRPSQLSPRQLEEEVKRCTRKDGTTGLVSLCLKCHKQAHRPRHRSSSRHVRIIARNKRLDKEAKLARGECECDARCQHKVTEEDVDLFEWDHLVQSYDDVTYRRLGTLATNTSSVAACDRERAKCRLLYFKCHREHSTRQRNMRYLTQRSVR